MYVHASNCNILCAQNKFLTIKSVHEWFDICNIQMPLQPWAEKSILREDIVIFDLNTEFGPEQNKNEPRTCSTHVFWFLEFWVIGISATSSKTSSKILYIIYVHYVIYIYLIEMSLFDHRMIMSSMFPYQ